jgi:hypothetical protein
MMLHRGIHNGNIDALVIRTTKDVAKLLRSLELCGDGYSSCPASDNEDTVSHRI